MLADGDPEFWPVEMRMDRARRFRLQPQSVRVSPILSTPTTRTRAAGANDQAHFVRREIRSARRARVAAELARTPSRAREVSAGLPVFLRCDASCAAAPGFPRPPATMAERFSV